MTFAHRVQLGHIVGHRAVRAGNHQLPAGKPGGQESFDQVVRVLVGHQASHREEEAARRKVKLPQNIGSGRFGRWQVDRGGDGDGITVVVLFVIAPLAFAAQDQVAVCTGGATLHPLENPLLARRILAALPFVTVPLHHRGNAEEAGNPTPEGRRPGVVVNQRNPLLAEKRAQSGLQGYPGLAEQVALRTLHRDHLESVHDLHAAMVAFTIDDRLVACAHELGGEIVHIVLDTAQDPDVPSAYEDDFHRPWRSLLPT